MTNNSIRKTLLLTTFFLSLNVNANSNNEINSGQQNTTNFEITNYFPLSVAGYYSSLARINTTNTMTTLGGENLRYTPLNYTLPHSSLTFDVYSSLELLGGYRSAMPYINHTTLPNKQTNIYSVFDFNTSHFPIKKNNSLNPNAIWDFSNTLSNSVVETLSSKESSDLVAQLLSGENADLYRQIFENFYKQGLKDATNYKREFGAICLPTPGELFKFN